MRRIYWNGKPFDYKSAWDTGHDELINRADELADIFEELTDEEKRAGLQRGEWLIIEE